MTAKFLNERLVTTKRFAPRQEDETERPASAAAEAAPAEVDKLVRREEEEIRNESIADEAAELGRRRREVLDRLAEVAASIEQETDSLKARLEGFRQRQTALRELDEPAPGQTDPAALGRLRREVQEAHIELVKFDRERAIEQDERSVLLSLTFGQLTRLGLGLTWPLLAGLLLAAAAIVVGVVAALRV